MQNFHYFKLSRPKWILNNTFYNLIQIIFKPKLNFCPNSTFNVNLNRTFNMNSLNIEFDLDLLNLLQLAQTY